MKINEFINNDNLKETFDRLKEDLYYETAHLSSLHQKKESASYKRILSYGNDILPYLIDEIRKGEYLCSFTLCLISFELIRPNYVEIPKSEAGDVIKMEKRLVDWWDNNKHNYGK